MNLTQLTDKYYDILSKPYNERIYVKKNLLLDNIYILVKFKVDKETNEGIIKLHEYTPIDGKYTQKPLTQIMLVEYFETQFQLKDN